MENDELHKQVVIEPNIQLEDIRSRDIARHNKRNYQNLPENYYTRLLRNTDFKEHVLSQLPTKCLFRVAQTNYSMYCSVKGIYSITTIERTVKDFKKQTFAYLENIDDKYEAVTIEYKAWAATIPVDEEPTEEIWNAKFEWREKLMDAWDERNFEKDRLKEEFDTFKNRLEIFRKNCMIQNHLLQRNRQL